jgi:hypothetical protein
MLSLNIIKTGRVNYLRKPTTIYFQVQMYTTSSFIEKIKNDSKWIVIKDNKVIISSNSHNDIHKEMKKVKIDDVYVFYSLSEKGMNFCFSDIK